MTEWRSGRKMGYEEYRGWVLQGRGGGDVNELLRHDKNWGILHEACWESDYVFVVWLVLHMGADPNLLSGLGCNVFYFADEWKTLKFLSWQGSDPFNENDNERLSFLHYQSYKNDYLRNESRRRKILFGIHQGLIHKDLWREVAEWFRGEKE